MSERASHIRAASEAVDLLRALKALEGNLFWNRRLLPKLQEALRENTNAVASLTLKPKKRAEHVQAFHFLRGLLGDGSEQIPGFLASERKRMNRVVSDAQAAGVTNADFEE